MANVQNPFGYSYPVSGGMVDTSSTAGDGGGGGTPKKSGGGGGGGKTPKPGTSKADQQKLLAAQKGGQLLDQIQAMNPGMSREQANSLYQQYQMTEKHPGLQQFMQQATNAPNPLAAQMFFQKTVGPYLQNIDKQYQQSVGNENAQMQKILGSSGMNPQDKAIMQANLPAMIGNQQQQGLAQLGSTMASPMMDQMLTAFQNMQQAQVANQAYQSRLAGLYDYYSSPSQIGGGSSSSSSSTLSPADISALKSAMGG